jgi:hypothetical protein
MVPAKRNGSSMQQQPAIQVESGSNESSARDSGSDDSSNKSKSSAEALFPNSAVGTLIPIGDKVSRWINTGSVPTVSNGLSVADDMKGLVLAPVVADWAKPTNSNFDRDVGGWMPLIRPDHCGGLLAEVRYLRGATKAQQAQIVGLTSEKPIVICIQMRFENQNADKTKTDANRNHRPNADSTSQTAWSSAQLRQ